VIAKLLNPKMQNPPGNFPTAIIFSELDDLSFSLCKQILAEKCLLKIICENKKAWTIVLDQENLQGCEPLSISQTKKISKPHYIIYHLNFFKVPQKNFNSLAKREIPRLFHAINLARDQRAKALLLLPYSDASKLLLDRYIQKYSEGSLEKVTKIFFNETIGPYFQPAAAGPFGSVVKESKGRKQVGLASPYLEVPLSSAFFSANSALRFLFSFGGESEILITGPGLSLDALFQKLKAGIPTFVSKKATQIPLPKFSLKQRVVVSGPSEWEVASGLTVLEKHAKGLSKERPFLDETKKGILYFVFSILLFLILPYLVLFTSAGLLLGAGVLGLKQDIQAAEGLVVASQKSASSSAIGFTLLTKLPLGRRVFGPGLFASNLLQRAGQIGLHTLEVVRDLETITDNFFSKKDYDVDLVRKRLSLELDFIYRELGFLQGDISSKDQRLPPFFDREEILKMLAVAREKISYSKVIAQELSWILGQEEKRAYLVLFQNNMELRPTGGYIGSFAIIGVEKGKLASIDIQDVFSADGQLKGHVEPPEPIKKYLGEAGWYLRDSNWDPDFFVSAQRAEWFLDKELQQEVDGVISVDLEAAKKLLDVLGEVEVADFSKKVSSKNLYEETRSQIEENFFPGSRTKANFLMAVASALLNKISDTEGLDKVYLARAIASSLEERNVQIFLHNAPTLEALGRLGWTGELPGQICPNPCFGDWVGLAEANVGVNKANYYIERKVDLTVVLAEGEIRRSLTITWKNNAPRQMGDKGRYEAYVRVLGPRGEFGEGQKAVGGNLIGFSPEVELVRGHIEAGTIVEVFPQETSRLSFSWVSPAEIPGEKGEYFLLVRKQAGTVADPWQIEIDNKLGKEIILYPAPFLTGTKTFGYNTILARDFVSRISW
jgi:hypothetical protein